MLALRFRLAAPAAYCLAAVFAFSVGILSEAVQIVGPRDADILDLARNMVGILGFLSIAASLDPKIQISNNLLVKRAFALAAWSLFAVSVWPTLWFSYGIGAQKAALPQLLTFERSWESEMLEETDYIRTSLIDAPANWPVQNGTVAMLEIIIPHERVFAFAPYPDWSDYGDFSFVASSATDRPIHFTARVHYSHQDWQQHDHFDTAISVGPSPKRISIPVHSVRVGPAGGIRVRASVAKVTLEIDVPAKGDALILDEFRLGYVNTRPAD
jgi:hypothetical protein